MGVAGAAVAAAVEVGVVPGGDLHHGAQELHLCQQVFHYVSVGLQLLVLRLAEAPLLADEVTGNGQLAHVVDQRRPAQPLQSAAAELELLPDELGEVGHPLGVAPGVEVLGLQGLDEAPQGGLVGLPQLGVGGEGEVPGHEHHQHQRQHHPVQHQQSGSQQAPHEAHHQVGGHQGAEAGPGADVAAGVGHPHDAAYLAKVQSGMNNGDSCGDHGYANQGSISGRTRY